MQILSLNWRIEEYQEEGKSVNLFDIAPVYFLLGIHKEEKGLSTFIDILFKLRLDCWQVTRKINYSW